MKRVAAIALIVLASCSQARRRAPEDRPTPASGEEIVTPVQTVAPSRPDPVRSFVEAFARARVGGREDEARAALSENAANAYASGEGGLRLMRPGITYRVVRADAADADSWEVELRFTGDRGPPVEILFVGPGPDTSGTQRALVVRGAMAG